MPTITALLLFILLVWLAAKVLRRLGTTSDAGASARYITIEPNGTSFAVWRMGRSIPERVYHPNMPIVHACVWIRDVEWLEPNFTKHMEWLKRMGIELPRLSQGRLIDMITPPEAAKLAALTW